MMNSLLPEKVSRWVRNVDAASKGDRLSSNSDDSAVWGRVLSGVFMARWLAAEEAKSLPPHDVQTAAAPKGLLVHARSHDACFYNWTRVVFPQAEKSNIIRLTPQFKSGALSRDPSVLATMLQKLYHYSMAHTKTAETIDKSINNTPSKNLSVANRTPHMTTSHKMSRLNRLNRRFRNSFKSQQ